jgi:hypothetical protein
MHTPTIDHIFHRETVQAHYRNNLLPSQINPSPNPHSVLYFGRAIVPVLLSFSTGKMIVVAIDPWLISYIPQVDKINT